MSSRRRWDKGLLMVGLSGLVAVPLVTLAQSMNDFDDDRGRNAVSFPWNDRMAGEFNDGVAFELPEFFGLAPDLGLAYGSHDPRAGEAGMGWNVVGAGKIRRVGPRKKAPLFTSSDKYLSDDGALVACQAGWTSPSCTSGGNYATEVEAFKRYTFDSTNNKWTVTGKDGTQYRYGGATTSRRTISGATDLWLLDQVTDVNGNVVTYTWNGGAGVSSGVEPYLTGVGFGPYSAVLTWETRPDPYPGTGKPKARVTQRLKGVEVKRGGSLARKYVLAYDTFPISGKSRLLSVKHYGKDGATNILAADRPIKALTYRSPAASVSVPLVESPSSDRAGGNRAWRQGDFNGDGMDDLIWFGESGTSQAGDYQIWRGNTSGPLTLLHDHTAGNGPSWRWPIDESNGKWQNLAEVGDFNGDGLSDLVNVGHTSGNYLNVYLGREDMSSTAGLIKVQSANTSYAGGDRAHRLGDFNGDGKTDVFAYKWDASGCAIFLGATNGVLTNSWSSTTSCPDWKKKTDLNTFQDLNSVADVNGDGVDDLIHVNGAGGNVKVWLGRTDLSSSAGPTYVVGASMGIGGSNSFRVGDVNGDGRADLVRSSKLGDTEWQVWLGQIDGTYALAYDEAGGPRWEFEDGRAHLIQLADVTGDGCDDLIYSRYDYNSSHRFHVWVMNPSISESNPPVHVTQSWYLSGGSRNFRVGDYNGDGLKDVAASESDGGARFVYLGSPSGVMTLANTTSSGSPHWCKDCRHYATSGDFDGDGVDDVVFKWNEGDVGKNIRFYPSSADVPYLVTASTSALGASTTIAYTPSTTCDRTSYGESEIGSVPMVYQVVSSMTVSDGRGTSMTTSYDYDRGDYDPTTLRSLGFRAVTATIAGVRSVYTTYKTSVASAGKVEQVQIKRASDQMPLAYEVNNYSESGSVPYVSKLADRTRYECNYSWSDCASSKDAFLYDAYGNVTTQHAHGDLSLSGDEKSLVRAYYANPTAFITDTMASEETYGDIHVGGHSDPPLTQRLVQYDGATSHTTPPIKGLPTKIREWDSSRTAYSDEVMTYDSKGNLLSRTDPLGGLVSTTWDADGLFETTITDPMGFVSTMTWDTLCGALLAEASPNGVETRTTIDNACRVSARRVVANTPAPETTLSGIDFTFTDLGDPTTQKVRSASLDGTGDGLWTDRYLDGLGREHKRVQDGDQVTELHYDSRGLVDKASLPRAAAATAKWVTFTYDELERVKLTTYPDGNYTSNEFNKRAVTETDELGRARVKTADAFGKTVLVTETVGGQAKNTQFVHDVVGRLAQIIDSAGNTTTIEYASNGEKTRVVDPDLGTWQWYYDAAGNNTSYVDGKGQTKTMTYDAASRLVTEDVPGGSSPDVTFTYDVNADGTTTQAKGRLTKMVDATGIWATYYDGGGLVTKTVWTDGATTRQQDLVYDPMGRVVKRTYPADVLGRRFVVESTYDAGGNVAALRSKGDASFSDYTPLVSAATYDAGDAPLTVALGNGVTRTFGYDANRMWLTSLGVQGGVSVNLTRNAMGNITAIRTSEPTTEPDQWDYAYDELDRLTAATNLDDTSLGKSYVYDALGNITSDTSSSGTRTFTYPEAGQARPHAVTNVTGSGAYAYDGNGNMTSGGGRTFTYNFDNRATSITYGATTTMFVWSALGDRVRKATPTRTVTRAFDLTDEITDAAGAKSVHRVYLNGALAAEHEVTSSGETYRYLLTDHLGGTTQVRDAAGAVVASQTYAPYGASTSSSGMSGRENGFTDQQFDESTALYDYKARLYDPSLGRFTSADTLIPDASFSQDLNRYAYVRNNPVNLSDPSGHAPRAVAAAASRNPLWMKLKMKKAAKKMRQKGHAAKQAGHAAKKAKAEALRAGAKFQNEAEEFEDAAKDFQDAAEDLEKAVEAGDYEAVFALQNEVLKLEERSEQQADQAEEAFKKLQQAFRHGVKAARRAKHAATRVSGMMEHFTGDRNREADKAAREIQRGLKKAKRSMAEAKGGMRAIEQGMGDIEQASNQIERGVEQLAEQLAQAGIPVPR